MPDINSAQPDDPRSRIWRVGAVEFDQSTRELRVGGQPRTLEAKPLALFEALLLRAGDVVTKKELIAIVWQGRTVVEESLTTAVSKLRTALGDEGRAVVEAVHGVGYRIGLPIELRDAPEKPGSPSPSSRATPSRTVPNGASTALWAAVPPATCG